MENKSLHILIKPSSSRCNLRCLYCFYRDVKGSPGEMMTADTAKIVIRRALEHVPSGEIAFAFQGGEPTLCGLPFYEEFVAEVNRQKNSSQKISYSIQTNGVLIDGPFAAFLKENHFLVGLSIDGWRENHDFFRPPENKSFDAAASALALLRQHGVDVNILTVVTRPLAKRAKELYAFYNREKIDFVQIIPCLDPLDGQKGPWSISPAQYGKFLKDFFDEFYAGVKSGAVIRTRIFDNILMMLHGLPPEQCGMDGLCHISLILESDGSAYPCDFYSLSDYFLGNIREQTVAELLNSPAAKDFLSYKDDLPLCLGCKAKNICGGGCRRYRTLFFKSENYCPMRDFLYCAYPHLYEIAHGYMQIGEDFSPPKGP